MIDINRDDSISIKDLIENYDNYPKNINLDDLDRIISGWLKEEYKNLLNRTNIIYDSLESYLCYKESDEDICIIIERILESYRYLFILFNEQIKILNIFKYEDICRSLYNTHFTIMSKLDFYQVNLYKDLIDGNITPSLYKILIINKPNKKAEKRFKGVIYQ